MPRLILMFFETVSALAAAALILITFWDLMGNAVCGASELLPSTATHLISAIVISPEHCDNPTLKLLHSWRGEERPRH